MGGHIYRRESLEKHVRLYWLPWQVPLLRELQSTDSHVFLYKPARNCREVNPRFKRFAMKATDKIKLEKRIRAIKELTDDERSALLGLLNDTKTYGLVWEDKPEEVEERLRDELPVLVEDTAKALTDGGDDAPNHILIEGDNLEALTTLAYTHAGKIDVIYIDPPYNTEKKDFIYNDVYVDAEDSYRHSKWLSFMSKRLKIARKLLSDIGTIFISIDDHSQSDLCSLCKEIFGENRYITSIPRITKLQRSAQEKHMDVSHDYVLCYAKSEDFKRIVNRDFDENKIKSDEIGLYIEGDTKAILADKSKGYSEGGDYDFEYEGKIYSPIDKYGNRNRWLWTQPRMEAAAKLGILVPTKTSLRMQLYLDKKFDEKSNTMVPKNSNLIFHSIDLMTKSEFTNSKGSQELKEIGYDLFKLFNNPKPLSLIKFLLSLNSNTDSYILDFFAGSGTTLHAVMELNNEDKGKRQCILCQGFEKDENGNDKHIAERVTYERNKRVINGYTKPNGEFVEGLHNNNLRYYRTDFVGRSRSMKNMQRLVSLSTDMLCIKENLYTEQKSMAGVKKHPQIFRFFDDGKKQMLIIYREEYIAEIVTLIEKMEVKQPMKVYVFSPSDEPASDLFESVEDKVELTALPAAIYNTYKRILPKKREEVINENVISEAESEDMELGGLFCAEPEGGDE